MPNMSYLKVKDRDDIVRNPKTNCIVNTNKSQYEQYIARRNLKNEEQDKVNTMEKDLAVLKSEITEIKDLLRNLANGN